MTPPNNKNLSVEDIHRQYTAEKLEEILSKVEHIDDRMSQTDNRVRKLEVQMAVLQIGYLIGGAVLAALFTNLVRSVSAAMMERP
jgi:hypothetical protein